MWESSWFLSLPEDLTTSQVPNPVLDSFVDRQKLQISLTSFKMLWTLTQFGHFFDEYDFLHSEQRWQDKIWLKKKKFEVFISLFNFKLAFKNISVH